MLVPVVLVLLTQAPLTMAAPPFAISGVDPVVGRAWEQRFVARVQDPRLKVTSARDIEQVLGLERQRQLLGCESNTVCLAELAGALGVALILSASIVKSDSGYLATLKVVRTRDGQPIFTASERHRSEGALLDWLDATAPQLRDSLLGVAPPEPTPVVVRWVPGFVGLALLAGSGASFIVSAVNWGTLTGPTPAGANDDSLHQIRVAGENAQWVGLGLAIGGGVGLLWSVVWAALAPAPVKSVQPVLSLSAQGGVLGVQAVWP